MSSRTSGFTNPRTLLLRRLVFLVPSGVLTLGGCVLAWGMMTGLPGENIGLLDIIAFAAFSVLFAMLSFTSWAVILGLAQWFGGRRLVPLEREAMAIPAHQLAPSVETRTAVLIPAYHEDAKDVFARVRVMRESLAALQPKGTASDIDIFVLSDSQNPTAILQEAEAYQACLASLKGEGPAVYYRRRSDNSEYKVGNIKEFCTRWGAAYDHMLVLDADSLMSGETIRRMIILMERHPHIGLLQTCFIPVGRETLFCRIMQFSTRLYLMPAAMGLELWQGANGNYWGHNALIRTRAFTESCGLPELPGKAPLGGRVLSHDIVEAAFLARAGWECWLLPNLPGTYEELPTNLIDFMQRDRRWCAGNLQHQHIIRADGVPFGNRLHMVLGILSYATGPLWLIFILLALVGALAGEGSIGLHLATAGFFIPDRYGSLLFQLTMVLLFVPKLLTLTLALLRSRVRNSFGGARRLLQSAVLEQVFVMLQQPAVMLFYTAFVMAPLCGHVVRWEAQPRSERGITWHEAYLRHRHHMLLALILVGILAVAGQVHMMLWMSPVLVGLLLGPAFTVYTSRASLGRKLHKWGLFLTPDELNPSPELKALQGLRKQPSAKMHKSVPLPALPPAAPMAMPPQLLRYPQSPDSYQLFPQAGQPAPVEATAPARDH